MPKIAIYFDFDGTLTDREGRDAVFSDFYAGLFEGHLSYRDRSYNYLSHQFKSEKDCLSAFERAFGSPYAPASHQGPESDYLISPEALVFFRKMLAHEDVSIRIVSKNRKEYILTVLRYQGLTEKELEKIAIDHTINKAKTVQDVLGSSETDVPFYLYLFDDSFNDLEAMISGAKCAGFPQECIRSYHVKRSSKKEHWASCLEALESLLNSQALSAILSPEDQDQSGFGFFSAPSRTNFPEIEEWKDADPSTKSFYDFS